jgi:carboxyl-terminal processing protease
MLSSVAAASPALDLFNQATYYITARYNGFSTAAFQEFAAQFRPQLDAACAGQLETCPYSVAVPIVQQMLEAMGDGHSYLLASAQRAEVLRQRSGLGPNAPRMGLATRTVSDSFDRVVADVWENSPAQAAGLRRGDRLYSVDGLSSDTLGADFQTTIAKAVSSGNPVRLGVQRGAARFEVSLRGAVLPARLPSLRVVASGVGLLRIPSFDVIGKVASSVHDLVRRAQSQKLQKLIVDVRDNPGGVDFEVLASIGAFVRRTGFTQVFRDSSRTQVVQDGAVLTATGVSVYNVPNPALWTGKIAVLVNSHSYSGAEYLAQLLQDAGLGATVIGEETGGLGNTGSSEFNLPDGSALVLTIFRSQRLDGTMLPAKVTPDVLVNGELETQALSGRDVALQAALEALK